MTSNFRFTLTVLVAVLLTPVFALAQQDRFEALANSPTFENRPTPESAEKLMDELLFQRASQAYLWAMPLINTMGMKVGSEEKFGAGYHVLPIWKKRLSAKTLVTTPNSDVIYAMSYVDLGKDGPLVFDAPPLLQGILLDFWQRPIPGPTLRGQNYLGDVGFAGPGPGQGRQVPAAAAGLQRRDPRRLLRLPLADQQRLHLPARVLPGPRRPQPRREDSRGYSRLPARQGKGGQGDDLS